MTRPEEIRGKYSGLIAPRVFKADLEYLLALVDAAEGMAKRMEANHGYPHTKGCPDCEALAHFNALKDGKPSPVS